MRYVEQAIGRTGGRIWLALACLALLACSEDGGEQGGDGGLPSAGAGGAAGGAGGAAGGAGEFAGQGGDGGQAGESPQFPEVTPDDGPYAKAELTERKPFAQYQAAGLTYSPTLQTYTLPLDLGQVNNLDRDIRGNAQFGWSAAAEAALQANGMVALPATYPNRRFDAVYSLLKGAEMPILVTTDSTLHLYHIFFDQILKNVEVREFIPMLRALLSELARSLAARYEALQGDLKEAARRDLAFVSVAGRLIDPERFAVNPAVAGEVDKAVEYIETAGENLEGGRELSPVFNQQCSRDVACAGQDLGPEAYAAGKACYCEDYTQYKPRGHYTESEDLERYFRGAMYLGRMSMRIKSPMETRMAALLTAAMNETTVAYGGADTGALVIWDRVFRPVSFFVGAPDDARLDTLRERLQEEREPRILSGFVDAMLDTTQQTMGLRFLGQRFVFDSYTLGELVFKHVGPNPNDANYAYVLDNLDPTCIMETEEEKITGNFDSCDGQSLADWYYICCSAINLAITEQRRELSEVCRLLPKGLDVAAAFGSDRAREHLQEDIEGYCGYREQLDSLQQEASAFTEQDWWKNLYNGWLYALQPLLHQDLTGFPVWMTTDAYRDKSLNTALASWAELRHDTILYVKQSYTGMAAGSAAPLPVEAMYWVEPMPDVYNALSDLAKMTRTGLDDLGLFSEELGTPFDSLVGLLDKLTVIAVNELEGKQLTDAEKATVEFIGETMSGIINQLGLVTGDKAEKPADDPWAQETLEIEGDPYKTTVVADVHTDGNMAEVLEVGSGTIDWLVVVRRIDDGVLGAAIGPIFTYYEFPWPMQDRLNDEQWIDLLGGAETPARPEFVQSFYAP
jgi:hypothetical protein